MFCRRSGCRRQKQYTLSNWVISKRKFGVPRNSFVHPKKKKNQWEFSTCLGKIIWDADYKKIHAEIICFPKATFKVQISSPEQINTHSVNEQTGRLRLWGLLPYGFFLCSLTGSKRGAQRWWQALEAGALDPARLLEGRLLHPNANLLGFLNLFHSNGLERFCHSQTLVMGIFLRQEEEAKPSEAKVRSLALPHTVVTLHLCKQSQLGWHCALGWARDTHTCVPSTKVSGRSWHTLSHTFCSMRKKTPLIRHLATFFF